MSSRYYTETHEWVSIEEGVATIGVTDYAQSELGDVVYVELPPPGKELGKGDAFGSVESVKAASDLYAPVGGTVLAVNEALKDRPEAINEDPFGGGWLMRVKVEDGAADGLLDETGYQSLVATEGSN
ncbi:MAG TPA: glycine cleavage system protein GcvH [Candidatus Dormibacteraeota bacterium]|nr:glycine cleavage system protein GcvH [Candidatus Dormibacteraeota bacterium]